MFTSIQFADPGKLLDYAVEEATEFYFMRKFATPLPKFKLPTPVLVRNPFGSVVATEQSVEQEFQPYDRKSWCDVWQSPRTRKQYHEAYDLVKIALRARISAMPFQSELLQRYIYLEDDQMYATTPHLFETDCPWSVLQMEELGLRNKDGMSIPFNGFASLMLHEGFRCKRIHAFERDSKPLNGYPIVVGATGNY